MDSLRQKNSNCFICDKSFLSSSDAFKIHRFSISKRFLKLASRYLNISVPTNFSVEPEKSLMENVELKSLNDDAVALENLNLDCCESCLLKVQNFCRLYDQWIQIKLGLDYFSKEIATTMKACPNLKTDGMKLSDFKKGFVNQVETRQRRIYPRIELERIPLPDIANKMSNEISDPLNDNVTIPRHSCGICGKMFSTLSNVRRHHIVHLSVKPFKCTYCDSRFTQKSTQIEHERTHTGETPFNCKMCGQSFKQRTQCRRHEQFVHNPKKKVSYDKKSYQCHICDKRFLSEHSHRRHMQVHTGEKNWACSFCGRKFFQKQTLLDHQINHTMELSLKCGFCENWFPRRKDCQVHQRREHLELIKTTDDDARTTDGKKHEFAPQYNYDIRIKCANCPEMFTKALNLRRHIQQNHNKNKPKEKQNGNGSTKQTGHNSEDSSSSSPQVVCKLEYKYEIQAESRTKEEVEIDLAQIGEVPSQVQVSDIVINSENFETHILPN